MSFSINKPKYTVIEHEFPTRALVSNLGLVAGLFDHFDLEEIINNRIGKVGSHVKVDCGCIAKCLTMQVLNAPYQTLSGTEEYFTNKPLSALTNQKLTAKDLNRHTLGRFLDSVYEYGCEKLFLEVAATVVNKLGIKAEACHIDTTSLHYDGESHPQENCDVALVKGYSRDHRPELNQIISLMMCETSSKLPIYQKPLSGNVSDNKSFNDVIKYAFATVRQQFKDLNYLVGDAALCTADNLKDARDNNIHIITRIPDKLSIAKECFEKIKTSPELLLSLDDTNEITSSKYAWLEDTQIGDVKVKRLLVNNECLKKQKTKTITARATKQVDDITNAIKKLSTNPCSCLDDAKKSLDKIIKKATFCTIDNINFEEVYKYQSRGKPKDGESKVLVAVKAFATVTLNQSAVDDAIASELMMVLTTTDVNRNWTPQELISLYKKQSTIERNWKMLKDPKFLINSIYLKTPSRITALLWLMTLSLLVYCAGEFMVRNVMKEHNLTIPSPDKHVLQSKPTMIRLLTYIHYSDIVIINTPNYGLHYDHFPNDLLTIIDYLGDDISKYYVPETYKRYFMTKI